MFLICRRVRRLERPERKRAFHVILFRLTAQKATAFLFYYSFFPSRTGWLISGSTSWPSACSSTARPWRSCSGPSSCTTRTETETSREKKCWRSCRWVRFMGHLGRGLLMGCSVCSRSTGCPEDECSSCTDQTQPSLGGGMHQQDIHATGQRQ